MRAVFAAAQLQVFEGTRSESGGGACQAGAPPTTVMEEATTSVTDSPTKARLYCVAMLPMHRKTPPASAKPTDGPLFCSQQVELVFGSQSRCRASEFRLLRPLCSKARRSKGLGMQSWHYGAGSTSLPFELGECFNLEQLTQVPLGIKT